MICYAVTILDNTGVIWKRVGTNASPLPLGGGNVMVRQVNNRGSFPRAVAVKGGLLFFEAALCFSCLPNSFNEFGELAQAKGRVAGEVVS